MTSYSRKDSQSRLVINADDFGYFPEVTRGIVECIQAGSVTATSIIVHRDTPQEVFDAARNLNGVDIGVHLNLTHGSPLTPALGSRVGKFPDKFSLLQKLLTRQISLKMISDEWASQMEVVRDQGIDIQFLNSHEHLHMFPGLFSRFTALARQFSVSWIRVCKPEWSLTGTSGHWLRTAVFAATSSSMSVPHDLNFARLVGIAPSGRLQLEYLRSVVDTFEPGRTYELMCHPGQGIAQAAGPLSDYHDWSGELSVLTGPQLPALLKQANVRLCAFSHA